jgi:alkylhydroperoxidase/carboxymuconolactone decarboxylase family protein YurZ
MKHPHSHIPFLVLAIAVTATVAALYAYMFYAASASVRQANLARDIAHAEGIDQSQARSLSALASSTADSRAHLASFFVPADNVVVFITALESIGPQSGSTVSLATVDADSLAGAPAGTIGSVRAHVDAHGGWPSVMRALSLAERMPYAVSIDNVRMDASGFAAKSSWNLSFDIQAAVIVPQASHQ